MTETQASILADRAGWFDVRVVPSAHPGRKGWSVVLRIDGDYTDHETALRLADYFAELLINGGFGVPAPPQHHARFGQNPSFCRSQACGDRDGLARTRGARVT